MLQRANAVDQFRAAEHGAGEQIVVAAQIFGRRMKHQIDAELQRPLVERRGVGGNSCRWRTSFPDGQALAGLV